MTAAPYSVTAFTEMVRGAMAAQPELEDVLVEGEISNLSTPSSGHIYFTLKDRGAALGCVSFRTNALRIPFAPENGMTVIAHGHVEVYAQQGRYQLYVDRLEPSGIGALALAVEQRRRALAAAGLFDEARKRPLPLLPRRVAVVTSRTGAALRDVVTVLRRRAPCVDVVLSPATVQGEGAAETIVLALRRAARIRGVEVVLLVRGGGSLEDMMAFNDEAVARAIAAAPIPVVTGIGHESDSTLADLVADRRAPTPSAAAELAVPSSVALGRELAARDARLSRAMGSELDGRRRRTQLAGARLDRLSPLHLVGRLREDVSGRHARLQSGLVAGIARRHRGLDRRIAALALHSPLQQLPVRRERLARHSQRLSGAMRALHVGWRRDLVARDRLGSEVATLVTGHRQRLHGLSGRLDALSPLQVLNRGYSLTADDRSGRLVTSIAPITAGMRLRTRLADGHVLSTVVGTVRAEDPDGDVERMYDVAPPSGGGASRGTHEEKHG